jgi:hypothetical protein
LTAAAEPWSVETMDVAALHAPAAEFQEARAVAALRAAEQARRIGSLDEGVRS